MTIDRGAKEELDALVEHVLAKNPAKCPKCDEPISIDIVAKAMEQSTMRFSYKPGNGELMDVASVMRSVEAAAMLIVAVGKETGVKTRVMLKECSTSADGELRFDLLITRAESRRRA